MISKLIYRNGILLFFIMIMSGWLSSYFGKELSWDLANYHYYAPFAFLHSRQAIDFWPSSYLHQYINPTIDLLSYVLINQFTPWMAEFILGAIHGINVWLLFLIAKKYVDGKFKNSFALFIAVFSLYGPTVLLGTGSFQNDNLITLFTLSFVLFQLTALDEYIIFAKFPLKLVTVAGLLLGLGFGLKLIVGIYILGAIIASFLLPIPLHDRFKFILILGGATAFGMVLSAGHWMLMMWQQHHNPLFPFFNNIFQSPDFLPTNWRDTRFLPKNIWQWIFYPFYFAWDGRTSDISFRDFRFPIVYGLFIIAGISWLWKKAQHSQIEKISLTQYWLFLFFIFSYFIWQYYFSIARYLATLEMLSPLVIFLLINRIFITNSSRRASLFIAFYFIVLSMLPVTAMRASWYDSTFFNVQLPNSVAHTPKATVLVAYPAYVMNRDPRPQQYLIPFLPSHWRFIGIPFWNDKYRFDIVTAGKILTQLQKEKNTIYLLAADNSIAELYRAARQFNLFASGTCEKIYSDRQIVSHLDTLLCPVAFNYSHHDQYATPTSS